MRSILSLVLMMICSSCAEDSRSHRSSYVISKSNEQEIFLELEKVGEEP